MPALSSRPLAAKFQSLKNIEPGHIYSYKVEAFNDGGKSFPSEALSIGVPKYAKGKTVMVVNNFTRVAAPAWFDFPEYAGFRNDIDAGVPYIKEINFIGEQFEYRRSLPWLDDDNPGFGASFTDKAGSVVPGNTFDFTYIHGKASWQQAILSTASPQQHSRAIMPLPMMILRLTCFAENRSRRW